MSQGTSPTNGRVDLAVLVKEVEHLTDVLLVQTAAIEALRTEVGLMRLENAVNEERWRNHKDLHKRERTLLAALSAGFSAVSGVASAWFRP